MAGRWIGLTIPTVAHFINRIDVTIVTVALAGLWTAFTATSHQIEQVVADRILVTARLLLPAGRLDGIRAALMTPQTQAMFPALLPQACAGPPLP